MRNCRNHGTALGLTHWTLEGRLLEMNMTQ